MPLPPDLEKQREEIELAYRARSRDEPELFIGGLHIPLVGQFKDCMAPFQKKCFADLYPSMKAVQRGMPPPIRRFWLERTKKAGKDSDIAAVLTWLIAFPKRPLYMQAGAANEEQASIIKQRISDLLFYNPWLQDLVEIQETCVLHKGGGPKVKLDILTASIAGSHGATPDVMVVNELSHITKWEFVENLLDNADGVPNGIVIVATNAGQIGSKSETWRRNAMTPVQDGVVSTIYHAPDQPPNTIRTNWCCHILSCPAPWHDKAMLVDARKRNGQSRYKRLWLGKWTSGKGDALTEEGIERCYDDPSVKMQVKAEEGWLYVAGLDLGVSHDHCGLVVVAVHKVYRQMKVVYYRAWEPPPMGGEINLSAVEETCLTVSRAFRLYWFGYDPAQAVFMAQRLRGKGCPMQEMVFNGRNLDHMATAMVQAVEEGILKIYRDEEDRLRRDLGKLTIVEKPYGYKLEAVRDEFGHADVGTALAICLPKAVSLLSAPQGWQATDDITVEGEMSDEDMASMPGELRELMDMDGAAPVYEEESLPPPKVTDPRQSAAGVDDAIADLYGETPKKENTRRGKSRGRALAWDADRIDV